MDERQKHPAPTAEPTRGGAQRRFRAGASTALSLSEKTSAANHGHPLQGMSAAGSNPVKRRRRCDRSCLRTRRFRYSYALAKGGQNRRAIRIGRRKRVRIAGGTSRVQRASHFGDPFFVRRQRAAREPIASAFPSVVRGLKPNPFGRQRLRSTNFPFGCAEFLARQIRRPSAILRMRSGPSGAGRPGRAFLCRTEGNALAMGQRPPAREKGSPKWPPTAPSPPPSVRPARP